MERLVTTSEAAKILNLSVQGVHYRIKNGQLRSTKQNGRVFVYIHQDAASQNEEPKTTDNQHIQTIIKLKDEQIDQFKKTIKIMAKQYKSEIKRLEKNQNQMMGVFNNQIQLLQQAFNEMRSLYTIEHKKEDKPKIEFISVNQFYLLMKKHQKSDKQIKILILQRIKLGDERFIFDKDTKKLHIIKSDFNDLI